MPDRNYTRWKLVATVLTNYSYALIGVGGVARITADGFSWLAVTSIAVGVVFLAVAVYISPKGERT